ncbi:hypothetical protein [Pseudogemmobacter sonorensis]|uniref:hypothetical protein n=1 Tax=Pseudogemmobacter sonorensis TaxID=2989681 RepID=UPI0036A512D3
MRSIAIKCAALAVLAACSAPPDRRPAAQGAVAPIAARIWSEPQVAGAVNLRASSVSRFVPGRDMLMNAAPTPLGSARYGDFDGFDMVIFDTRKASHAQIAAGMRAYCAGLGRSLVQVGQGMVGAAPASALPPGWISGMCR